MIQQLRSLNSLKFLLTSFLFLLLLSCTNRIKDTRDKNFLKLNDFFKNIPNIKFSPHTSSILILTGNGCYSCNKEFTRLLKCYINTPNNIILVEASSSQLDLSSFMSDSCKNVFIDYKNTFAKLKITDKSSAIFLSQEAVDTIISIDALNLKNELRQIEDKLTILNNR